MFNYIQYNYVNLYEKESYVKLNNTFIINMKHFSYNIV